MGEKRFSSSRPPERVRGKTLMKLNDLEPMKKVKFHKSHIEDEDIWL